MLVQYGLPEIGIPEERIATSKYLGCSCGLNHFIPCFRRSVCVFKKRPVSLSRDKQTGFSASMELIQSVFPNARVISQHPRPTRPRDSGAGGTGM